MIDFSRLSAFPYAASGDPDDPRLGSLIQQGSEESVAASDVVIFGIPTDEGVRRNGGRVGAGAAPGSIRSYLSRLTPFAGPLFQQHLDTLRIVDLGDIPSGGLEEMHEEAQSISKSLREVGKIVIALGGGHDVTYPLVKGFRLGSSAAEIGLINIDAHLDVRPLKGGLHHSGSSFRLLIEEGIVSGRKFAELGIQSFSNAREHFDWILQQGARILTFEDATTSHLPNAFEECEFAIALGDPLVPVYLSFDMDSVRASDAPGVSAPAPIGFLGEEAFELSVAAGLNKTVGMFDIVEVNPSFDIDGRTSRLAAKMVAGFLAGVANRNVQP